MNRLDPVLVRGLAAIAPYLDTVVVAGGWVPHLYELLYDATAAGRSPRTRDIDLAVPRSVPVRGRSIDELLKGADFRCEFHSLDSPPVTKYVATQGDDDIEIEFITDAPGASVMNSISISSSPWVATYFVTRGESSEWNSQRKSAPLSSSSMLLLLTGTERGTARSMSRVRGDRPAAVAS